MELIGRDPRPGSRSSGPAASSCSPTASTSARGSPNGCPSGRPTAGAAARASSWAGQERRPLAAARRTAGPASGHASPTSAATAATRKRTLRRTGRGGVSEVSVAVRPERCGRSEAVRVKLPRRMPRTAYLDYRIPSPLDPLPLQYRHDALDRRPPNCWPRRSSFSRGGAAAGASCSQRLGCARPATCSSSFPATTRT